MDDLSGTELCQMMKLSPLFTKEDLVMKSDWSYH